MKISTTPLEEGSTCETMHLMLPTILILSLTTTKRRLKEFKLYLICLFRCFFFKLIFHNVLYAFNGVVHVSNLFAF
ncbi:hypothetical protein HanRHA438_Chr02g0091971 [Helianthus annuus]|nr:hypothetical protein HanRHA438_Chr02g0091971 [Helianthus annuus]